MISIKPFFKHPQEVCMNYWKHLTFSFYLATLFAEGTLKACIHAVIPDYYIDSSSKITKKICEEIENSGCKKKSE